MVFIEAGAVHHIDLAKSRGLPSSASLTEKLLRRKARAADPRQQVESAAETNIASMSKQPRVWMVDFDSDAVIDFEDVKSRGDRKAIFNVVQKLKDLGPDLPSSHMKSLKGEGICSSCGRSRGLARLGRSMRDSAADSWSWR